MRRRDFIKSSAGYAVGWPLSALAQQVGGGGTFFPHGVTLRDIDGGSNYYGDNGFTYAHNAGWDNPSFFPIGLWLAPMLSQSDANRWRDLNLNTAYLLTANSSLTLMRTNGFWLVGNSPPDFASGTQYGSETVGLLSADENYNNSVSAIQNTANSVQDNRFWWLQNTWHVIGYGDIGRKPMAQIMTQMFTTPNGTKRHFDILSADTYWFTGAKDAGMLRPWGINYNLNRDATIDEGSRGCHYGTMVDRLRVYQAGHFPAPIPQFIENGEPGNLCDNSAYITPPEVNAAVWASIIHGARQIIYFNHTFCGSHRSQDNVAQPFYRTVQPGQTISIYNQIKATNALVKSLAPVINSPFAIGYVSVTPAPTDFGGFDVMAKWYSNSQFYIFAMPRYSPSLTNQSATFTITNTGARQVTVVSENRTINITNGGTEFADTFPTSNTVRIYQVG